MVIGVRTKRNGPATPREAPAMDLRRPAPERLRRVARLVSLVR